MRVVVDSARCQGHNRCLDLAPELFTSDELGYALVISDGDVADSQVRAVELAELNCPEQAIEILP